MMRSFCWKIVQVVGIFLNSSSEKQQSQKAKSKWSSVCLKVKKNDFQFSALISCSGYILTSVNTQAHAGFSTIDLPFQSRRGIFSVPPWLEHELIHWQCWDSPVGRISNKRWVTLPLTLSHFILLHVFHKKKETIHV